MKAQPRRRGRPPRPRIVQAVITDAPPVLPQVPAAAEPEPEEPRWLDLGRGQPFCERTAGRQAQGPYLLLLADGSAEVGTWRAYLTESDGRAWAWHLRGGLRLAFHAPVGWRLPAEG